MVDRFPCPYHTTEIFSFDACRKCKFLEITRGKSMSVRCRKIKDKTQKISFESAFLLDYLGLPYQVEIVSEN